MTETIEIEGIIPAPPEAVCAAFLDARIHSAMTGARATVDGRSGRFTAWDGYIEGRTLEVEPARRILQTWRTSDFPEDAPESRLELLFERTERGTRMRIVHGEIPFGQGPSYAEGWAEHYFAPMQRFFAQPATTAKPARAAKSAKPARAAKSAKPARTAKSAKPARAAKSAKPARTAKRT